MDQEKVFGEILEPKKPIETITHGFKKNAQNFHSP